MMRKVGPQSPSTPKGRTALITGGESGLVAATAKSPAQAGADVAITYHDAPEAAEVVAASALEFCMKAAIVRLAGVANQPDVAVLFQ